MYYGLQNFYQNHRRYMISRSDAQLLGRNVNVSFLLCPMRWLVFPLGASEAELSVTVSVLRWL